MPASFSSTSYTPDQLLLGGNVRSRKVTVLSGQGACVRGHVLGKISLGAASSAAKSGGNTGNGTLVLDATTPILANAHLSGAGVYTVRAVVVGTHIATFVVIDPQGVELGEVQFSGAGASGTFSNRIKFAVTDGSTDFIVGDGFDITIAAGSGKYKISLAAAIDGSQEPDAILAEAVDATSADVDGPAYFSGDFKDDAITLGAGHTASTIREGLRKKEIHLITVQTTY